MPFPDRSAPSWAGTLSCTVFSSALPSQHEHAPPSRRESARQRQGICSWRSVTDAQANQEHTLHPRYVGTYSVSLCRGCRNFASNRKPTIRTTHRSHFPHPTSHHASARGLAVPNTACSPPEYQTLTVRNTLRADAPPREAAGCPERQASWALGNVVSRNQA